MLSIKGKQGKAVGRTKTGGVIKRSGEGKYSIVWEI